MSKPTIKDIADKAGVSKTSVSYAFNYPERLPKETVQKILDVAKELRYIPNPIARSMISGRVGAIGILLPMPIPEIIPNPFMSEFLFGVSEVCASLGFSIMLIPPYEGSMEQAIGKAMVDGFLTLGVEKNTEVMNILERRNVPYLMVDSEPIEGVPAVNIDDYQGAKDAMNYILEKGHRNIVIVGIKSESNRRYQEYVGTLKTRIDGYLEALNKFNIRIDSNQVKLTECETTLESGKMMFNKIWESDIKPTAIVAMCDISAIGIMTAAQESGIVIPNDLSIIGFDDISCASFVSPKLTTIRQPIYVKGELAVNTLIKCINGKKDISHHVLPTKLIIRESVNSI